MTPKAESGSFNQASGRTTAANGVNAGVEEVQIGPEFAGQRLDQVAAAVFPSYSRSRLQTWIKSGELWVDGAPSQAKQKLRGGECLRLNAAPEAQGEWLAEALDLNIVYEDEALLVLNKPANMVVHPAAGNPQGTLLNALLHHCPDLINLPRAGIVHRLDKDTTGLMVVAKTLASHQDLVKQLQARSVGREYEAIVGGHPALEGRVEATMGRHPRQRKKMAVLPQGGKAAVTHYRVLERFPNHSYVRLKLETGRTHQIRVHMSHLGFPLVGDQTYGARRKLTKGLSEELASAIQTFPRQALHARRLALVHPLTGKSVAWEAPAPADFAALLDLFRGSAEKEGQ